MPSLSRTSSPGRPTPHGVPGHSLIWLWPLSLTPPLRNRPSPVLLTPSFNPAIAGIHCCNPESAPPGSLSGGCVTMLGVLSPPQLPSWICPPSCTLLGTYTTLLNLPVWSLPAC